MKVPDALRHGCFVTGTDTGSGKTYFGVRLIRALRREGLRVCGFKPICCGDRDDAFLLASASEQSCDIDLVNPVWIKHPVAPFAATMLGDAPVQVERILDAFALLKNSADCVIVEGAGGWLVPLLPNYSMADLALELGLPVVIVVNNKLGAINHALLTAQSVAHAGVPLAGWVLNTTGPHTCDPARSTNRQVLEQIMPCPLLFDFPA